MKKFKYFIMMFMMTIGIFFVSCRQVNTSETSKIAYFDTKDFVKKEVQNLLKKELLVKKKVVLNGNVEEKQMEAVDSTFLYNSLSFLAKANINKPALLGQYKIDSVWNAEQQLLSVCYAPVNIENTKLKTRKLINYYHKSSALNRLELILHSQNFMHEYHKELSYQIGLDASRSQINVKAWEKTLFQDTIHYSSTVLFE